MPGEPGVKVPGMGPFLMPVTSAPSKLICFFGVTKVSHEVAPLHAGHSRGGWGGKGAGTSLGLPLFP